MMLHLLVAHLIHARHRLVRTIDRRRRGDTGALTTLELVVLALGVVAVAALCNTAFREAITSRLDQLR